MLRKLLALGSLLTCSVLHADSGAQADSGKLQVPAMIALTGDAESFGSMEVKGMTLAIEEINSAGGIGGKQLELRLEDTQSSNRGTITAYRKLRSSGFSTWMLGPTWLDSYQALSPIVTREKLLLITPSASMDVLAITKMTSPYAFSTWLSLKVEIDLIADYIANKGTKRVALISDQDPYFQAMRELLNRQLTSKNVQVVEDMEVASGTDDLRSAVTKLKHSNPEAVYFALSEKSLFPFLRERRQQWAGGVTLYSSDYIDGYALDPTRVMEFEDVEYIAVTTKDESFIAKFKNRFGVDPVLSAAPAYDAVNILAEALRSGAVDPDGIAEHLRTHEHQTVSFGRVRFTPIGSVDNGSFRFRKIKNGKLE